MKDKQEKTNEEGAADQLSRAAGKLREKTSRGSRAVHLTADGKESR